MEEIAVAAIDFGVGLGVGALLSSGATALSALGVITISGGWVVAGTFLGMVMYNTAIKPHVEEWIEEGQFRTKRLACSGGR